LSRIFLLRLVIDGLATGLLLFAFAYFWQGNAAHELTGTAMFLLIVVHNLFHWRWFARLAKKPRAQRGKFNFALTFVLLTGMLALVASSLMISESLFSKLRLDDDFTVRQIHAGIAYWLLVIVGIHLGLRWPMLMAVTRKLLGIVDPSATRTTVLRIIAIGIAIHGMWSLFALNLHYRLLFQMTLDWWNFEDSVAGFFVHCLAIVGLCIVLTNYTMQWLSQFERKTV
jgi:hypothetical protein